MSAKVEQSIIFTAEGKAGGQFQNVNLPQPRQSQADNKGQPIQLPLLAIQNLAQLIEQQRRQSEQNMASIHPSPFQGRPISPSQPETARPSSEMLMRTCFSESSANALGPLSKQVSSYLLNRHTVITITSRLPVSMLCSFFNPYYFHCWQSLISIKQPFNHDRKLYPLLSPDLLQH